MNEVAPTIEQGSPEWHALRLGKATASRISDIVRNGRGNAPSASRTRYLGELVAERLTGQPTQGFKTADMQWGNDTEPMAREAYTYVHQLPLHAIAFVDHATIAMAGASPDCLVGDDGLLEIKCPATHTHISTLLGAPIEPDYVTQMQWQMACTGRAWCDFVSFDPRMPEDMRLHVRRLARCEVTIMTLEASVIGFLADVDATVDALLRQYRAEERAA